MKQKIIPIAAVIIGIVAFLLTDQYLRGQREKLEKERALFLEGAQMISVVAAARDIPSGTKLSQGDLGKISVPRRSVGDRAVLPEEVQMLYGKKVQITVNAKNPVLWSDIEGGGSAGYGLAPMIGHGMRAISLNISGAQSVSGMVQPNDRVDVMGTFVFPSKDNPVDMEAVTLVVLQNVTLLATGQKLAKDTAISRNARQSATFNTVTLEVTPEEAELLVFAEQSKGRLTLALRNPSDVSYKANLPDVNFAELQSKIPRLNQERQTRIGGKANP
jgi:pilus assembly protein CpaB